MKTIVIFESAQNSGGSTYRAVEMAARITEHKFIFLTFMPLNKIYRDEIPSRLKTKRIYSLYFDYHASSHIEKFESVFKNKILRYAFRQLIEATLSFSKLLIVFQAMLALSSSKVDVVQGNNGVHYLPYWVAKLKGANLFFYFRDLRDFTQHPKKIIAAANQYVFVGKNLMEQYIKQLGLSKTKCIVIHSPFNVEERIQKEPLYEENPIKAAKESGKKVIICSSRISPAKGQAVILKAYDLIAKSHPDTMLYFVGEADNNALCTTYLDELNSLIREKKLSNNVCFLGFRKDVLQLTKYADIAIQAPTYFEALSGSLVESVQLGTPTISSDIGGANEVITDGVSGFLFPPGDFKTLGAIIEQVLNDNEKARALAEKGKKRALDQWNPEKMKELLCNVYEAPHSNAATPAHQCKNRASE